MQRQQQRQQQQTNLVVVDVNIEATPMAFLQWVWEFLVCLAQDPMLRVPERLPIFIAFPSPISKHQKNEL